MVTARFLWAFAVVALIAGCQRLPAYNTTVSAREEGAVWEARLLRAQHNGPIVIAEIEYANRAGPSFSVRPENIRIVDDKGKAWFAAGRHPYIPLLRPGGTAKVLVGFQNVVVDERRLILEPFYGLVHESPRILLKEAGGTPLPGDHPDPRWDIAR